MRTALIGAATDMADEAALAEAYVQRRLELHFQPQLRCVDGRVTGFEALARWMHPRLGLVSIGPYLDLAEANGLILAIGEWALRDACRQAATWPMVNGRELRVAVNVSPRQLAQGTLPAQVQEALRLAGLAARRLEIEVAWHDLPAQDRTAQTLHELRALGVTIALAGLGSGSAALESVSHLPLDCLKIDRRCVANLGVAQAAHAARAVLEFGRRKRRRVVAEGVQEQSQLDWLRRQGGDEYQGMLARSAIPGSQVGEFLNQGINGTQWAAVWDSA
jgi:EAL domain-containing protein (putative c-di-GMP-specific phosphodiesterase class I)